MDDAKSACDQRLLVGAASAVRTIAESDTVRQNLHEQLTALGYQRSVVVTFTAVRRWAA